MLEMGSVPFNREEEKPRAGERIIFYFQMTTLNGSFEEICLEKTHNIFVPKMVNSN